MQSVKEIFMIKKNTGRQSGLDTFRFFGAGLIWFTHFVSLFAPEWFEKWKEMPLFLVLYGLSGKLGVAILCVTLGYLAYIKGMKNEENAVSYMVKRYGYFVIAVFIYHLLAIAFGLSDFMNGCGNPVKFLIKISLTFNQICNGLLWCLPALLIGSVVSFVLGKYKAGIPEILCIIAVFLVAGEVWVSVCLMGNLAYRITEDERSRKILGKWYVKPGMIILGWLLIKGEESTLTYFLYGLSALLGLILVVDREKKVKAKRSAVCKAFSFCTKSYFGLFLLQPLFYQTLAPKLMNTVFVSVPFMARFFLVFIIITILIILMTIPVNYVVNVLSGLLNLCVDKVSLLLKKLSGKFI